MEKDTYILYQREKAKETKTPTYIYAKGGKGKGKRQPRRSHAQIDRGGEKKIAHTHTDRAKEEGERNVETCTRIEKTEGRRNAHIYIQKQTRGKRDGKRNSGTNTNSQKGRGRGK